MQKNNVNIVVFDENQSFVTEQSRVNYSTARRATHDPYNNQTQSVIVNQIASLNEKLSSLQQKADRIQQHIKIVSQNSNSATQINASVSNVSVNSSQIEQLLRVAQLKIQIVVQQTKKIIQKMTSQFDKRLNKATSQKNHEITSISKIQAHCRDTITKIQQGYQQQLGQIRNQHEHLQKRLIQKVEQMEKDYKAKLKDFKSKEQQLLFTIQQLEGKVRTYQSSNTMSSVNNSNNKSKKCIQITQERPISSIKSDDNLSNISSQQIGSSNALPNANDTSRRRTRIFDGKSSNKSVSPNNPVLSPIKSNNNVKLQPQKMPKQAQGMGRSPYDTTPNPVTNNFIKQAKQGYHNIQVKATVIPDPNSQASNPTNCINIKIIPRALTEKTAKNGQQNMTSYPPSSKELPRQPVKQPRKQKQFIREVPKVQWEKFQDFNDEDDSGEEEDVFFYPEHNKGGKQEPRSVFDYQSNNSSMHSPFDLK